MSARRAGGKIATEMELGPEEEDSQEQSENHDGAAFCPHVPYRREIMGERLRGQGTGRGRRGNGNAAPGQPGEAKAGLFFPSHNGLCRGEFGAVGARAADFE